MKVRKYGLPPFSIVLLHGGPGGTRDLAPVAKEISKIHGVLEPLQTKLTINGQIQELKDVIQKESSSSVIIIGHSWGAWLAFIFTANYPSLVKKLILLSSGPFEASYAKNLMKIRLNRLSEAERLEVEELLKILNNLEAKNKDEVFAKLGKLLGKADSYDPFFNKTDNSIPHHDIYKSIWPEADELRKSGKLLSLGKRIKCPVVAIHGDYDSHPAEGVKKPLSSILKNFHFILLKNCGHTPWLERKAYEEFYKILKKELD